MWARTCQECGYIQEAKEPAYGVELSTSYCNAKCKKCKSMSLNYGSSGFIKNEAGKIVRAPYSDDEE